MTPMRTALVAAAATAAGFFAVAQILDVTPGRPMASRTDVFFQSDAGGLIDDAINGNDQRARGVHPAVYPLWTAPLHRLARALAPGVPVAATATYVSRIIVNAVSGIGIGFLVFALARRGLSSLRLGLFLLLLVTATGNTLAAIPDHFGLSLGLLAAAFGVYLRPSSPRLRVAALFMLTLATTAVTISNCVFPLILMFALIARELTVPRWFYPSLIAAMLVGLAGAVALIAARPDVRARIDERVNLYLTWKLTRQPGTAVVMMARGTIDSMTGATPVVRSDNNLDRMPMLTYQDSDSRYAIWPYDSIQSAAAFSWIILLFSGIRSAWCSRQNREPITALMIWCTGNAIFHTVWGDEYFLYTPHYAWAFLTATALGWPALRLRYLLPLTLLIAACNLRTLFIFRDLILSIAQ